MIRKIDCQCYRPNLEGKEARSKITQKDGLKTSISCKNQLNRKRVFRKLKSLRHYFGPNLAFRSFSLYNLVISLFLVDSSRERQIVGTGEMGTCEVYKTPMM